MNNSDIIAALSLAVTAIIFLIQTDDGLLQLKVNKHEKWIIFAILSAIILLINHQILERFGLIFYFKVKGKYLVPSEWALLLFFILIFLILKRIFTQKIYNRDDKVIFNIVSQYRREKKWSKLTNVLTQVMALDTFETLYAEQLNDTIFSDQHIIEYFASNFPEILIAFSKKYKNASINRGEYFFYILDGLFADKGNSIFSEIQQYHNIDEKRIFMEELRGALWQGGFHYDAGKNYITALPIISWLVNILKSYPFGLRDDTSFYISQFTETASDRNNEIILSENEIKRKLSRDSMFNSIQLFRILVVEICMKDEDVIVRGLSILALLYSTWDFIEDCTKFKNNKIRLDNDYFTINEFYLNYLFNSYLSIYFILKYVRLSKDKEEYKENDYSALPLQQLFSKLGSLIGNEGVISDHSKHYYIKKMIELYFEMPQYFKDNANASDESSESILYYLEDSLKESPYGDVQLIRSTFCRALDEFDFLRYNNPETIKRAKHFYKRLLPYTKDYEWKINDHTPW